jgi:hypothetical protein
MGRSVVLSKVPTWPAAPGILQKTSRKNFGWLSSTVSGLRKGVGTSRFCAHVAIINVESR